MKKLFLVTSFILALGATLLAQDCATGFCPATITVHHKAGSISPIDSDITYGVVTTTLFTGTNKCAITRNLGATTQAASSTDGTAASAGWYWQFNRPQGYSYTTSRTPNTTWITSISESSDWLYANDPCRLLLGGTWRLPTNTEWTNADGASGGNWNSYADTYNSVLKLHAAGYINSTGALIDRGIDGRYASSHQTSTTSINIMWLTSALANVNGDPKTCGDPVRCLRDY